jgi:hypothetical protein
MCSSFAVCPHTPKPETPVCAFDTPNPLFLSFFPLCCLTGCMSHTCLTHTSPAGSPFTRPSQMRLRGQLAVSLEAYWDRLESLITFGISCSSRLPRLALVRMLARMCGVGGGTSPQLGPAVSTDESRVMSHAGAGSWLACMCGVGGCTSPQR